MASAQLKQLRRPSMQLKSRLEKEAKANATASKVVAEAKKARDALMGQLKTLRDEGGCLAQELKSALGDADKREAARRQAVEKIAELRAELTPSHRGTQAQVGGAGQAGDGLCRARQGHHNERRPAYAS